MFLPPETADGGEWTKHAEDATAPPNAICLEQVQNCVEIIEWGAKPSDFFFVSRITSHFRSFQTSNRHHSTDEPEKTSLETLVALLELISDHDWLTVWIRSLTNRT